jgi:hypothetical protein
MILSMRKTRPSISTSMVRESSLSRKKPCSQPRSPATARAASRIQSMASPPKASLKARLR